MKVIGFLYFMVCGLFLMARPAYAYIDPSVMTFAVQVVAGVAIAVGAVAGVLWRRAKKKVQEKLGIDENAGKEVEEDIVEIDED